MIKGSGAAKLKKKRGARGFVPRSDPLAPAVGLPPNSDRNSLVMRFSEADWQCRRVHSSDLAPALLDSPSVASNAVLCAFPWASTVPTIVPCALIVTHKLSRPDFLKAARRSAIAFSNSSFIARFLPRPSDAHNAASAFPRVNCRAQQKADARAEENSDNEARHDTPCGTNTHSGT